ncbi:unnamed protein product [Tilletia controversa]|uniref:Uncharacterized protein n=4 Tax=Tilletia TaxID=13289 RepID=A0A8X7SUB6_9BASI|nr:hypothetical protein CF336_g6271 [Tilletia laevis]KAE8190926.1 hypothetical protein CF328_g5837 [Tilletia controversa]CAD6884451.1 unnamed protein product [Tilletia caries]KAE8193631.1 hypothetical protein CF335_g5540 [Tilletia laevis]KAE8242743.1 hypothetical protein A4X06_0g6776 [Tilletia controversa]
MSEAPAKFPGSESTDPSARQGPAPSAENPAGVFPKSDPHAAPVQEHHSTIASSIENPYALNDALTRLDVALEDIIALFQQERQTTAAEGSFSKGKDALEMFKSWQQKIEDIRTRKE